MVEVEEIIKTLGLILGLAAIKMLVPLKIKAESQMCGCYNKIMDVITPIIITKETTSA